MQHTAFSRSPKTSTRVSITVWKHGKCPVLTCMKTSDSRFILYQFFAIYLANSGVNRVLTRSYSSSNSITICSVDGRGSYPRSNSLPVNRCGYSLSFEKRTLARHLSNPYEGKPEV